MAEIPETRDSLLVRLRDPHDAAAWQEFSLLYRPVIYRLARGRGLQDADAQDLAQHVLMAVASAIPNWQRSNPEVRFRHWLRRVTKNATINALTRRPKDVAGGGTSVMDLLRQCPDGEAAIEREIEWEHRREVFRRAAGRVRDEVSEQAWQTFALTVIDGCAAEDVAERTGKSIGSVYVTRSRVLARLRAVVNEIEEGLS